MFSFSPIVQDNIIVSQNFFYVLKVNLYSRIHYTEKSSWCWLIFYDDDLFWTWKWYFGSFGKKWLLYLWITPGLKTILFSSTRRHKKTANLAIWQFLALFPRNRQIAARVWEPRVFPKVWVCFPPHHTHYNLVQLPLSKF